MYATESGLFPVDHTEPGNARMAALIAAIVTEMERGTGLRQILEALAADKNAAPATQGEIAEVLAPMLAAVPAPRSNVEAEAEARTNRTGRRWGSARERWL